MAGLFSPSPDGLGLFSEQNLPGLAFAASLLMGHKGDDVGAKFGTLATALMQQKAQQRAQEEAALRDQMLQMQLAQAKRASDQQAAFDAAAKKNVIPGQPQMLPTDQELPSGPPGPASFNLPGYLNDVTAIDPMKALAMRAQLASLTQKNLQKVGPGETLYDVTSGKPAFSAPSLPKMVDVGNAIIPMDPQTGKPVGAPIPKGMSPDAQASNAIARANLGINQQKLGIEQFNADPMGMFGINKQGGQAPQVPVQGASGDDFLKTLPKPVADQVKALADGRMAFPGGFALKSPYWQSMISMVSQYDPSFDAINYNARSKTRNAFTSGQPATQINAMNTVIGHLQSLSDAADALNNKGFTPYNTATNFVASKFGDPRIQQFEATKKAVVDELTRVWRGNGGSEGDIKTWASAINASNSPQQLHGVIAQIGDLLESKISAMGEQYRQGMGKAGEGIQLLTPKSRGVLSILEKRAGGKNDQMPTLEEINAEIARRGGK